MHVFRELAVVDDRHMSHGFGSIGWKSLRCQSVTCQNVPTSSSSATVRFTCECARIRRRCCRPPPSVSVDSTSAPKSTDDATEEKALDSILCCRNPTVKLQGGRKEGDGRGGMNRLGLRLNCAGVQLVAGPVLKTPSTGNKSIAFLSPTWRARSKQPGSRLEARRLGNNSRRSQLARRRLRS